MRRVVLAVGAAALFIAGCAPSAHEPHELGSVACAAESGCKTTVFCEWDANDPQGIPKCKEKADEACKQFCVAHSFECSSLSLARWNAVLEDTQLVNYPPLTACVTHYDSCDTQSANGISVGKLDCDCYYQTTSPAPTPTPNE